MRQTHYPFQKQQGYDRMILQTEGLNAEGTTIVMVTHSPEDAAVGRRIIRMRDGRIISESINAPHNAFARADATKMAAHAEQL